IDALVLRFIANTLRELRRLLLQLRRSRFAVRRCVARSERLTELALFVEGRAEVVEVLRLRHPRDGVAELRRRLRVLVGVHEDFALFVELRGNLRLALLRERSPTEGDRRSKCCNRSQPS